MTTLSCGATYEKQLRKIWNLSNKQQKLRNSL